MGWQDCHLHAFRIREPRIGARVEIGIPDEDGFGPAFLPGWEVAVLAYVREPGQHFEYEYDFGDGWEHEVLFEGSPPVDPKAKYPLCLEGERACPPEDCGGVWGYGDFLAAIANPKHEEHESMLEWIGGRFDPEVFDSKKATKKMRKVK
jgi:hypothetical protein